VIGNRYAMRVASQVMQDMLGATEWLFGVDDPVIAKQGTEESSEFFLAGQRLASSEKSELILAKKTLDAGNELAAEHSAEDSNGKEKVSPRMNPAFMIRGQSATGDDAVNVRMRTAAPTIP
jgi:hypothetical protein